MRQLSFAALCLAALVVPASAQAPAPGPLQILPPVISQEMRIVWEVKNRFRLFRREQDFLRHVAALNLKTVLAAEQQMAAETDGRGWAAPLLSYLCVDAMGALMNTCERDGQRESYLAPADYRVEMRLIGAPAQTTCAWVFNEGDGQPRNFTGPCGEEVRLRLGAGKPTTVTVDAAVADGPPQRATTEIVVRDLLIAGLGNSVAAGEGNPDRPVALSDEGFCFRRFITGSHSEYYRPGRAGFKGDRTCESGRGASELAEWSALGARWLSQACHRSLYGYQLRTALALAVENPHVAVTFLPLACTGAIDRQRRALLTARARAQLHHQPAMPEHGAGAGHAAAAVSDRRAARAAGPHARSRAADRRGERHRFLRPRRQRDHRRRPPTACWSAAA